MNLTVPYTATITHVDAVEANCHQNGNVEHWYCTECNAVFTDAALTQLTNFKSVVTPATAEIIHVDAVQVSCHQNGCAEYWYCAECNAVFADATLTVLTNVKNLTVPYTATIVHVNAKDATCTENGNVEYWYCEECNAVFTDAALTQLTNFKSVQIGTVEHEYVNGECDCGAVENDEPAEELGFFDKIWQAIVDFFKSIGQFFSNLFGGKE